MKKPHAHLHTHWHTYSGTPLLFHMCSQTSPTHTQRARDRQRGSGVIEKTFISSADVHHQGFQAPSPRLWSLTFAQHENTPSTAITCLLWQSAGFKIRQKLDGEQRRQLRVSDSYRTGKFPGPVSIFLIDYRGWPDQLVWLDEWPEFMSRFYNGVLSANQVNHNDLQRSLMSRLQFPAIFFRFLSEIKLYLLRPLSSYQMTVIAKQIMLKLSLSVC